MPEQRIELPPEVSRLIVKLNSGWSPSPVPSTTFAWMKFGTQRIETAIESINFQDDSIKIDLTGDTARELAREPFEGSHPLTAETTTGWRLASPNAFITRKRTGFHRSKNSPQHQTTIKAFNWEFTHPNQKPTLWTTTVAGALDKSIGNLKVTRQSKPGIDQDFIETSTGHWALTGSNLYCLVSASRERTKYWHLVIQPDDGNSLNLETLNRELFALQFSLGTELEFGNLYGTNGSGATLQSISFRSRPINRLSQRAIPPVPNELGLTYSAPLFSALCQLPESLAAALLPGIAYSIESIHGHIDGQFLKLHAGIEASARGILRLLGDKQESLVIDQEKWSEWISLVANQAAMLAIPGNESSLITQLHDAAIKRGGRIISDTLDALALSKTPEMESEISTWEHALNFGFMSAGLPRDAQHDLRRIEVLRTILIGLIARTAKYDGPIAAWENDIENPVTAPGWGSVGTKNATASAGLRFSAAAWLELLEIEGVWPKFSIPHVPKTGLVGRLARFADGLSVRTGGKVIAAVQPIPSTVSGGRLDYDVVISLSAQPNSRSLAFTASLENDELIVRGWGESDLHFNSEVELDQFLLIVAQSPEITSRIERMLIIAMSLPATSKE